MIADLNTLTYPQIADKIVRSEKEDQQAIFETLSKEASIKVFEFLPFNTQQSLTQSLPPEQTAEILREMAPDDRTSFLEELPIATFNALLKTLPLEEKTVALTLLGYPKDSVGRLMTTDYIAIKSDWSVENVLSYVREHGQDSETLSVLYVIDDQGKLIDDIRIQKILLAPVTALVEDLTDRRVVSLFVYDKDDDAIKVFLKEGRTALPVTDKEGTLIGIVTVDDILALIKEEDTEDIQKIGGTEALDYPYIDTPFLTLMQKRGFWLVILFLGELLTASAMGYFEDEISKAVVLALFLPLIISSGGNSGSQASTLIIRALVIGEITLKDWWKIVKREVVSGLFLGTLLGSLGFFRIYLWSFFSNIYGPHSFIVATTIFVSLIGTVLWGTLSGAMLPFILKKIGIDPAVASAPLVATLVDVTGIIIYFTTASIIMHGTLL
jgi:magnesium transporter